MLASHSEPDGDAVSSILALGLAIGKLGKKTTIYNASPIPAVYRFLPSVERIVRHIKKATNYDLALVLDCGDLPRVGEATATVSQIPVIINIDHHISTTGFGDIQLVDPLACSTADIVYRRIKAMDVPIDNAMATAYEESHSYTTGCFVGNLCQELADTNAAVAEKAEYLFRIYTSALARCIRSAQDAGEVNREADPDRLAEAIFNSWEGAILRMKSSRNIQPLNAFLDMLAVLLQ